MQAFIFMKKYLLYIFIFLSTQLFSQTVTDSLHYNITTDNGLSLGHLKVMQNKVDEIIETNVTSQTKIKLFVTVDLTYHLYSIYKDKHLIHSLVSVFLNKRLHSKTKVDRIGNTYQIFKNGQKANLDRAVIYSGSLLYFKEPIGLTQIFSEFDGLIKSIDQIGAHQYRITNPVNGKTSIYHYQDGILQQIIIHHKLLTVKIERLE